MFRLLLILILVAAAYWAGSQGVTYVDVLEWMEGQGLIESAQGLLGDSVQWTEQQALEKLPNQLEALPNMAGELVQELKDTVQTQ